MAHLFALLRKGGNDKASTKRSSEEETFLNRFSENRRLPLEAGTTLSQFHCAHIRAFSSHGIHSSMNAPTYPPTVRQPAPFAGRNQESATALLITRSDHNIKDEK